jgi:hypothetical protein
MAEAAAMTGRPAAIVEMIHAGEILLAFDLAEQARSVLTLLNKHATGTWTLLVSSVIRTMQPPGTAASSRSIVGISPCTGATGATSFR